MRYRSRVSGVRGTKPSDAPLMLGAATSVVLIVVAVWETRSFRVVPGKEIREI